MKLRFYHKKTCSTCRNAKKFLEQRGAELELVDLDAERLGAAEIEALIGERDYRKFLNTRNALYRERKMKLHPPTRDEAVALMAEHPNLIKRPLTVAGEEIILGFDEEKLGALTT
ncbi:MAG: arsenate reductase family protein [Acidobacteria bacterium]|nr:arsenate reductase family protein [Acidobacteriota bacterium]